MTPSHDWQAVLQFIDRPSASFLVSFHPLEGSLGRNTLPDSRPQRLLPPEEALVSTCPGMVVVELQKLELNIRRLECRGFRAIQNHLEEVVERRGLISPCWRGIFFDA